MRLLLTISLALWLTAAQAESVRVLVQSSPLAGSQYYAVGAQWQQMKVGDPLDLIREPDNHHDKHAIRVEWRGHKLGYVPRIDNAAVSHLLDNGQTLDATIVSLQASSDPWQRIAIAIRLEA